MHNLLLHRKIDIDGCTQYLKTPLPSFGEGGEVAYYLTDAQQLVKVINLTNLNSNILYHHQITQMKRERLKAYPAYGGHAEFKIHKQLFGLIVLRGLGKGCTLQTKRRELLQVQVCQVMLRMLGWVEEAKGKNTLMGRLEPSHIYLTPNNIPVLLTPSVPSTCIAHQNWQFAAPEMLNNQSYNFAADLFSLASILYWVHYGQAPFVDKTALLKLKYSVREDGSWVNSFVRKIFVSQEERMKLDIKQLEKQLKEVIYTLSKDTISKTPSPFLTQETKRHDGPSTGSSLQNLEEVPVLKHKQKRQSFSIQQFKNMFSQSKTPKPDINLFEEFNQHLQPKTVKKGEKQTPVSAIFQYFGKNEDKKKHHFDFDSLKEEIQRVPNFDTRNPFTKNIIPKHKNQKNQKLEALLKAIQLEQLQNELKKNQHFLLSYKDMILEREIGSGGAGQVFYGRYKGQEVAVKKIRISTNSSTLKEFERELLTFIKMENNKHLVKFIGVCEHNGDFYLVMEYCEYGSLFDVLHKRGKQIKLTFKDKINIAIQIGEAMLCLHTMSDPIIHRDLKSLNVLVKRKDGKWVMKLGDFGLSRCMGEIMTGQLGTIHWMAPELLEGKEYSQKVDVYSFGILLWEIMSQKTPYSHLSNPMSILKYVVLEKKRPPLQNIEFSYPSELVCLIKQCWSAEAKSRPSFEEIVKKLKGL